MSDTPKFTVVDRRKFRAEEESSSESTATPSVPAHPVPTPTVPAPEVEKTQAAPRLKLVEPTQSEPVPEPESILTPVAVEDLPDDGFLGEAELPPAPTPEESSFQKAAYDKAAERLEDLIRAQNPGAPATEKIGFEHLVQQLYLSAMMQMGAGTPEGQRPRIDILGARQTIDLLEVVGAKTAGNLSKTEERTLQTVLYELRTTFLELTRMIAAPKPAVPPPGPSKR